MAGADVMNIGDADFDKEVLKSDQPVLVDFWATWCAPCRAIAPAIEELATQYKGKVKVAKIDIDNNQQVAEQYGIRSIPTLLDLQERRGGWDDRRRPAQGEDRGGDPEGDVVPAPSRAECPPGTPRGRLTRRARCPWGCWP